ncbi:hypothetical protein HY495_01565, partial [Candidatus Woesearchaeota archaeon]|nr:hypothetical protein [Candidatus Woesearchaeota archaeon]
SKDHKQLIGVLNKLVKQERWRKIPKASGTIIEKSMTQSGNLKFIINKDMMFYVLKRNKNLFETAFSLSVGDEISVALRRQLGKQFAVKITKKNKEKSLQEWLT